MFLSFCVPFINEYSTIIHLVTHAKDFYFVLDLPILSTTKSNLSSTTDVTF